jgi:hypothetical protein
MVTCVFEQCIHLSDWLKLVCSVTTKTFVMHVLEFMLEECSFLCDCFKKYFFLFLNVSVFTVAFYEQDWSWHNFPNCLRKFHYWCRGMDVLNACGSSIFVFWELCIKHANILHCSKITLTWSAVDESLNKYSTSEEHKGIYFMKQMWCEKG